jgi:large subunit ribosomal protein L10
LALTKEKKEARVTDIHDKFTKSSVIIMLDYTGLKVSESTEFRKKLRDVNASLKAGKNTLFKLAAADTHAEPLTDYFVGQKALVMGFEDTVAPAKVTMDFLKNKENINVVGGVLSGKFIDEASVKALAALPSREELMAKLLSVFIAVPTSMVQVLAGVPRKLLYALKAIEQKK